MILKSDGGIPDSPPALAFPYIDPEYMLLTAVQFIDRVYQAGGPVFTPHHLSQSYKKFPTFSDREPGSREAAWSYPFRLSTWEQYTKSYAIKSPEQKGKPAGANVKA